jgi:cell division septation protein DedD
LFFVEVALCGVFFAMGYLIGRNSTRTSLATGGDSSAAGDSASGQRQQAEPPRDPAAQPDASSARAEDAPMPPGIETRPAQDGAGAATLSAEPEPKRAAPVVSKPASPVVRTVVPAVLPGVVPASLLEAGASYLQVAALQQRADADNVIRTLREQSLPAMMAQNPKDGLFHVLVGPYHQIAQVGEAKAKLKMLGFANAFVQRQ